MTDVLVRCRGAGRAFGETVALQPTELEVRAGERLALVGPSGSGKSTLLSLLAGLDDPTVGEISWPAIGERAALRPGAIAVVFQGPSLLPPLTLTENVALPMLLAGVAEPEAHERAAAALETLGLTAEAERLPEEISGGQAQRAAVARALAVRARLILADEPTGQLDSATAAMVTDALLAADAALVVATHDPRVADRLARRIMIRDGRITAEVPA
ncbi:MAG: putative transport system ATP-binding protein [Solirubrobacteraceae bacterium]|nr:putative transport system ATP-binding protein [Solirubrobacteraceae bacterium]